MRTIPFEFKSLSSCPALCRASTSCFLVLVRKKDVDGRVKPGHDGCYQSPPPLPAAVSAPDDLILATSFLPKPRTLDRISSVCSPSSGERFTSEIESDILIGLPTDRYLPRTG